ncbi:MAG: tol-pal system protein YbgF [Methylophilaceae bacterium]|nr:tol-pal system protein YbgF [Methylophilaceae bacterium]
MRLQTGVFFCWLLMAQSAQAALFDDTEARKQIVEQQKKILQLQNTQQTLEQRLASVEAVVKGQGLVDLLNQNERLTQEISQLKGQLEVATHNIDTTQQRQRDLYGDMDSRLRKLEDGGVVAGQATKAEAKSVANTEASDYDAALGLSKAGKHKEAFEAFDKFLQNYPASGRAADAQFNVGYSQFMLKNYKAAIATQQKLIKQYPDSAKLPEAMFNIANCEIQLSQIAAAKKTLRDLLKEYPGSEISPSAKKRLTALEALKLN